MTDASEAREAARRQWSAPAGTNLASAAPGTPAFFEQMTATRYQSQPWHPALLADFHPTGRLLEIGCGAGTDHFELAKMARETYAVDLAQEGVDLTNQRLRLAGLPGNAQVADAEHLPFDEAFFDEVYSFGVIHHTDHPDQVAREMFRVIRPRGRFLVALYHRYSLHTGYTAVRWALQGFRPRWRQHLASVEHGGEESLPMVRLYSQSEARRLFSAAGFTDVRSHTEHPWFVGALRHFAGAEHLGWYIVVQGRRP